MDGNLWALMWMREKNFSEGFLLKKKMFSCLEYFTSLHFLSTGVYKVFFIIFLSFFTVLFCGNYKIHEIHSMRHSNTGKMMSLTIKKKNFFLWCEQSFRVCWKLQFDKVSAGRNCRHCEWEKFVMYQSWQRQTFIITLKLSFNFVDGA